MNSVLLVDQIQMANIILTSANIPLLFIPYIQTNLGAVTNKVTGLWKLRNSILSTVKLSKQQNHKHCKTLELIDN